MFFGKDDVLSPSQLKRLSEHKYSATSSSLSDPILQPWWNWLVSKLPIWLAPNLITLSGLIVNIVTSLILMYYSPDCKTEPPRWACLLCGLGLFVYQSLDAIDGKQARRTGTSSPLGELFDHGCDSISTVFVALAACISIQLGQYPFWVFFQCFCAITLFYCAHWQTYVSGTLRFGKIDVTEAQLGIILVHFMSAILGPSFWMMEIKWLGLTCVQIAIIIFIIMFLQGFIPFIPAILYGGIGKNGSTIAGTSVLSPIIPILLVIMPAYAIYQKSVEHVYEENPVLYVLAFGIVAAKVTNRLVVAHMTKSEMLYLDSALLGPAMLFLNQYFNFFIKEKYVLWACLIWATFDLLWYCSQVCKEICNHLHIYLFKIPVRSETGANVNHPLSPAERNGVSSGRVTTRSRARDDRRQ